MLRSSFLLSPFILFPLPFLRLSIKPTKGKCRSAQKDSPLSSSSTMAAPFLSLPPLSSVLFQSPLLLSLPLIPPRLSIKLTIGRLSSIQSG